MNLPIAPIAAIALGVATAAALAAMPMPMLEGLVTDSGIASVLPSAAPPLGNTARFALAIGSGGVVALLSWFALFILLGTRGLSVGKAAAADADADEDVVPTPVLRRADAHPDAPPRPPLLATRDLGTPFLEVVARARASEAPAPELLASRPAPLPISEPIVEKPVPVQETAVQAAPEPALAAPPRVVTAPAAPAAEQPLPADLSQTLAAFDPGAIPAEPAPLPEAVAPLHRPVRPAVFDDSERFETFELTPPVRHHSAPKPSSNWRREEAITRPETEATVHALLERLERGVVRRGLAEPARTPREAERGLEDALVTLRNLARRA